MRRGPRDGSQAENFPFAKHAKSIFHELPDANTSAFKYGAMSGPNNKYRSKKKKPVKLAHRPLPDRFSV